MSSSPEKTLEYFSDQCSIPSSLDQIPRYGPSTHHPKSQRLSQISSHGKAPKHSKPMHETKRHRPSRHPSFSMLSLPRPRSTSQPPLPMKPRPGPHVSRHKSVSGPVTLNHKQFALKRMFHYHKSDLGSTESETAKLLHAPDSNTVDADLNPFGNRRNANVFPSGQPTRPTPLRHKTWSGPDSENVGLRDLAEEETGRERDCGEPWRAEEEEEEAPWDRPARIW